MALNAVIKFPQTTQKVKVKQTSGALAPVQSVVIRNQVAEIAAALETLRDVVRVDSSDKTMLTWSAAESKWYIKSFADSGATVDGGEF